MSSDDIRDLSRRLPEVDLEPVRDSYAEAVFRVRDLGVAFSDRRAVKVQKLLAASALLCGRAAAEPSDLWVLRHVWDRAEQIAPLRALVRGLLEQRRGDGPAHPRAAEPEAVDGEEVSRQLDAVERDLEADGRSLVALARLRERAAGLADRAVWVGDEAARVHLLKRSGELLKRLG